MKLQWKSFSKTQENNFSDFAQRKSLIEKDVNRLVLFFVPLQNCNGFCGFRTDRNMEFFAGDNNLNLQTLNDILMTYVMYNFDLGYVQGMSDLLSPILMLLENECDSFWCFVGFMNKLVTISDWSKKKPAVFLTNQNTSHSLVGKQRSRDLRMIINEFWR